MRVLSVAPGRWVVLALALMFAVGGLTACSAEVQPSIGNCSPSYTPTSKYGRFSAQQRGPGAPIQWGIYPNMAATRFVVDVYVGSHRVDRKDQNYPPHGSVSAADVRGRARQIFRISGTAWDSDQNTLAFTLQCYVA